MLSRMRHFLYRFKYLHGRHLPLRTPVDVSLELASSCNMACEYCYHSDPTHLPFKRGLMDTSLALNIIDDAAKIGVHSLKFNYRGEGTLHPHYEKITQRAKDLSGGSVFIDRLANSNFKIPPKNRESVFRGLANLTKVKVSYDSFRAEVFEKQRAKGIHALTTENIDLFYNHPERIKNGTDLIIQAVRTSLNADEDLEGQIRKRWPGTGISIRDMVAGRVDKDVSELETRKRDKDNRIACRQAFVRLIVHHDGQCGPCCPAIRSDLLLGSVASGWTLKEVFNGLKARELRKSLIDGSAFDLDPCKSCSSFESYKGYKANWNS